MNYNFKKCWNSRSKLLVYYDEEKVAALYIFKSGWTNPQRYHCIIEWGEYDDSITCLYTAEEIQRQFGLKTFLRKEKLLALNK